MFLFNFRRCDDGFGAVFLFRLGEPFANQAARVAGQFFEGHAAGISTRADPYHARFDVDAIACAEGKREWHIRVGFDAPDGLKTQAALTEVNDYAPVVRPHIQIFGRIKNAPCTVAAFRTHVLKLPGTADEHLDAYSQTDEAKAGAFIINPALLARNANRGAVLI